MTGVLGNFGALIMPPWNTSICWQSILITYLYDLAFSLGKPGPAAAISLIMLLIVFAFTVLYLRLRRDDAA